ncbi:MAG: family 10 glycosylhydrolase [Leptolyngbyaceae cyanobacterium bins.59]|nr:family 10 glycosylhydrolase [Leptolyngbyaceae cyanobacterium bins.59]
MVIMCPFMSESPVSSVKKHSALAPNPGWRKKAYGLAAVFMMGGLITPNVQAQSTRATVGAYCQQLQETIDQKESLRLAGLNGNAAAQQKYQTLIQQHGEALRVCRSRTWPQNQALWIRLYPCDLKPGVLDNVMDRIVNRGYNQVYVEVFYNGQVLLPKSANPTPWPSVVRTPGTEKLDLFAEALKKGRERGLKVYAWMFTLNFGYTYAQRSDRQQALARNGKGQFTLSITDEAGLKPTLTELTSEEAFIDPYHPQARADYYQMVQSILQRRPDGVLFDYVRYPKGSGTSSIASHVYDLWIYSIASQQALFNRALNNKGVELIRRYLTRGYITTGDVVAVDKQFPGEGEPLWEGRTPTGSRLPSASQRQPMLQQELWFLSAAHAVQGVLDFLTIAASLVRQQGLPAGAVFFPEGNQAIGQGFDSRLQAWDRFPTWMEWHPMSYGICGNTSCIASQVQRVLGLAGRGVQIKPVLAGVWGESISNRPALEAQMEAVRRVAPQVNSISHFAYSWQEPQSDRDRKFCKL